MGILIGSTGFVGGHLARSHSFSDQVHRNNITRIMGLSTDILVCAGLPAEKWRANQEPTSDFANMAALAQTLTSVQAQRAVLISTIDVYQPAIRVNENTSPHFDGEGAYGRHRAWFEVFFRAQFPSALVIRLPGLYAPDVRKNLVHDLVHRKETQWAEVNPASTFQFFDVTHTWNIIQQCWEKNINVLNVTSEPVTAHQVASLFGVRLTAETRAVHYDMRSIHAHLFDGHGGYLTSSKTVLDGIDSLRQGKVGS